MSVCSSVRVEHLTSYWKDFHKISFGNFRKYVEKIKVVLKYGKNNGQFTGICVQLYDNIL